jgi:hypothetical protein
MFRAAKQKKQRATQKRARLPIVSEAALTTVRGGDGSNISSDDTADARYRPVYYNGYAHY